MDREIKFRGQNIYKKWCYGDLITTLDTPHIFHKTLENELNGTISNETLIKSTIGQYTGLKDAKGKEIYEGDIVTTNDNRFFTIEYREEEAAFKMIDYSTAPLVLDIRELTKKGINEQRIKVVGNIHDNQKG